MAVTHIDDLKLPTVEIKAGELVLEEGVASSKIYILQTGEVSIVAKGEEICKVDVRGAVFGEASVLLSSPTSAKVEATQDSTFLLIDNAEDYLQSQPELIYNIAQILAGRLLHMNQLFIEMRGEIGKKASSKIKAKLYNLMVMTNKFFDRDVMHPLTPAEEEEQKGED